MPQFQHVFFQIRQNWQKRPSRKQHKKHMQKVSNNYAKPEAQHLPKQVFRLKWLHLLRFAAPAKTCSKWPQKAPWNNPKIFKIDAGGLPKAMPKISIKISTNKMHKKSIWEEKWLKIASRKAYSRLNLLTLFSVPSSKLPPGGPRTPKIMTKSRKTQFLNHFFMHVCICCIRFV